VGRLEGLFTQWRSRSLASEAVVILYLDAIVLRVRIAKKVISVPVLVGLGVKKDGQNVILDLELFQSESSSCWEGFVEGLVSRGLKPPCLVIIDGNKGLRAAVEKNWPGAAVQRCPVHKLRNLERYAPRHAWEEVKSNYHRIVYAESLEQAKKAYRDFISKWKKLAPKVVVSFGGRGRGVVELLPFSQKPVEIASHHQFHRAAQWGVSPPGEDPEFSARCARSRAFVVWFDRQWADPDTAHRWMARPQASFTVESRVKGGCSSLG
jgi:transposase-like protein